MANFYWTSCSFGNIPSNALNAGRDSDGSQLYVGRAFHEGDVLPAKVSPSRKGAFVSWAGKEHSKSSFEVLCGGPVAWVMAANGEVPKNAVPGGCTAKGEILYIGRVMHFGSLTPGKIHPSHKVCYIPYDGKEIRFNQYEVLVKQ